MANKAYSGYLNPKYIPRADLVAAFYIEPAAGVSFQEAAQAVASESSIGTWTNVSTLSKKMKGQLHARVFSLNKRTGIVKIAYPSALFEKGNIPQLLSSIAGNVFGMKEVKNLRLLDINFPNRYIRSFPGPAFGIQGIRRVLKIPKRPLLGTIVKPKLGLNAREHASVAEQAWLGGCDIVKDDENLTSMRFNPFGKRLKQTLKLRDKAEKVSGERKAYMPNVTAPFSEMMERARLVKRLGCEYAMVDIVTVGWSALQELRDADLGLILHAHRAGHAAFTRNPKHGISMLVLGKLCRLIGLDQLHVGAIFGKMEGGKKQVRAIGEEIEDTIVRKGAGHILAENWLHIKPVLAVCSGGLHPGRIPPLVKAMGNDIVIQLGGGIHGHPLGTRHGAIAAKQALEATLAGVSLDYAAMKHFELALALRKWPR
jgi:ribulose-bisphosphate carboxylase large chain